MNKTQKKKKTIKMRVESSMKEGNTKQNLINRTKVAKTGFTSTHKNVHIIATKYQCRAKRQNGMTISD